MSKRKESDSGLRAGFVHEDDAMIAAREQAMKQKAADALEDKDDLEKEEQVNKELAEPKAKKKKNKPQGPTVSMQGVSGKVITGVVKVIKKVSKDNEADEVVQATAAKAENPAAAEKPVKEEEKVTEPAAEKLTQAKEQAPEPVEKTTDVKKHEGTVATEQKAEPESVEAPVKSVEKQTEPKRNTAQQTAPQQPAAKVEERKEMSQQPAAKVEERKETPQQPAAKVAERKETSQQSASKVAERKETPQQSAAKDAERKETPQQPAAVKKPPIGSKQRPLVDRGVTESRFADRPRIRPQKGNYIGKNTDTPAVERRGGRSNERFDGRSNDRFGGKSNDRFGGRNQYGGRQQNEGGRGRGRQQHDFDGFDKDKDEDERPKQSRSPRRDKRRNAPMSAEMNDRKNDSRKQYSQRNQHDRHRRDYTRDHQQEEFREAENLRRNRRKEKARPAAQRAVLTNVKLPESLTVKELAEALKKTTAEVITKLMGFGVMATVNQELDYDTAEVITNEFGIKAEKLVEITAEDILFDDSEDKEEDLVPRPPVVVVMGHVDHGKTSILDYIRKASVASGEAGGITQHIGAYTVDVHGKPITFLDTPGHEAFTTMRARGAQVTDIAILVVAADDGVMPQTIEAINHARAADTEIIVAINKIDKNGINIDRVKQELAQQDLLSEDWGGTTTMVPVSAKTGENMDELLEMITLTAEVMELKTNPDRQAKGTVIESKLDRGRGPVATVLVQRGTLRVGDTIVVGSIIGHIRAMTNDKGKDVSEAGPSMPVEILGLPEVPEGGDIFYAVKDEKIARQLADKRRAEEREQQLSQSSRMSLDNLFAQLEKGEVKDLNIIVKADVQGSVEAVKQSLEKLSNDEVRVQVIHGAVGAVTESDVRLAEVSNAVVIGFNVRPAANVAELAEESKVDIRLYRVIYDAIEDMEKALKGMLAPTFKEVVLGHAEVRETFRVSGVGTIAGCYVTDGKILRSAEVRVVRDGVVIHEGKLASLRRFKDDVREVASGYECGIGIERFNDIKLGDVVETYEVQELKAE